MDDYMEMDVEIIDNRRGAIEVLNNLWSFGNLQTLRLENCLLEDEDLARIRYEAPKVSYVCLRGNRLHSPWNCLVNKFPNVIFLDLTQRATYKRVSVHHVSSVTLHIRRYGDIRQYTVKDDDTVAPKKKRRSVDFTTSDE